ncbi:MAG: hypothetical protein Q7Q71_11830 [Verrucomicrobiota bacterium JB023]|nr:hypothetical protein [Verrucomicrobiota bacterium JB023]
MRLLEMNPSRTLLTALAFATQLLPGRIISPDGSAYTNVTANSVLRSEYDVENLFDQYLTVNQDPGSGNDSGRAWATNASVSTPIVSFELDAVYDVDALAYAQRQYLDYNENDKCTSVNIWVSETTPFSSASAPATTPQVSNLLLQTDVTDLFKLYRFPSSVRGRYFLLEFNRGPSAGGIGGGTELRLVTSLPDEVSGTPEVISPDGSLYTNLQANSSLNAQYGVENLFDQELTVGDDATSGTSDSGSAWAIAESDGEEGWVSFELDRSYQITALHYAQRQFSFYNFDDKARTLEIWSSSNVPITEQPSRAADRTLTLNENSTDLYLEYTLDSPITGRYFFLRFSTPNPDGHLGGAELRLVGYPAALVGAPRISSVHKGDDAIDLELDVPYPGLYRVQFTHDLSSPSWTDLHDDDVEAQFPIINLQDTLSDNLNPVGGKVFYRIQSR